METARSTAMWNTRAIGDLFITKCRPPGERPSEGCGASAISKHPAGATGQSDFEHLACSSSRCFHRILTRRCIFPHLPSTFVYDEKIFIVVDSPASGNHLLQS